MKLHIRAFGLVAAGVALMIPLGDRMTAQTPPAPAPAPAPAQAPKGPEMPTNGVKLEIQPGTTIRYRVREQLAGIDFPSDAVGQADGVKGAIVFKADGTIDSAQSKLTVDLRTLKSDQEGRDNFIQGRTLETAKFPTAEFVPKSVKGLTYPFPTKAPAQAGFQLIGDMTVHGTTAPVTWKVVATFNGNRASGVALTTFPFSTFGLTKPSLARLMSVDDNVTLEIEFRAVGVPLT